MLRRNMNRSTVVVHTLDHAACCLAEVEEAAIAIVDCSWKMVDKLNEDGTSTLSL
jgi:hypothetical protein